MRHTFYLLVLYALFSNTSVAAYLSKLDDCNAALPQVSRYTVLDKGRNTLKGWSHIQTNKEGGEYSALKLSNKDYLISLDNYVADKSCAFSKVQHATLVVKLSDWTRHHSNGYETLIDNDELAFSDVGYLLIDLKINRVGTAIDDLDLLRQRYDDYLTAEEFSEFDQGKVNLGLALFDSGALDQSTNSLNAELIISIDQDLYFDQWIRVIAPTTDFNAYFEKDYTRNAADLLDYGATKIGGFRLKAESSHGQQLRNILGDNWSEHLPETFKEVSVRLRRIELLKRR